MTHVTQTILGRGPEHDEPCGNCMQAAIASVLNQRLEDIPHFLDGLPPDWSERMNAWLQQHFGVWLLTLEIRHLPSDWTFPRGYHLIIGRSPRDSDHVVVGRDREVIWDPHPSRAGLVEPKFYEVFVSTNEQIARDTQ